MLFDEESRLAIVAPLVGAEDSGEVGLDGREDEGATGELLREIRSQRKALIRQELSAAMGEAGGPDDGWDWETLAQNARDYLAGHSKDLEPMAVLIEASVRLEGPSGVAGAMATLADLVEAFWERGLYPAEDEDGVSSRFQPLSGLSGGSGDKDGALIQPLRRMTLVASGADQLRYVDKIRADSAMEISPKATPEQKAAKLEEAEASRRAIEAIAQRLPRRAVAEAADRLGAAETAWRRAIGFISERTKPQFPAASRLSDELQAIRVWLEAMLARMAPDEPEAVAAAVVAESSQPVPGAAAQPVFVPGKITRREDALHAVSAAAEYFLTHEPQSPLGGTLREVDRRARLSLHDFLAELIPDESNRESFYWRSGIKPPSSKSEA
ncbi:type VI secretion system protein TssA [Sphingomonas parva]|uniref:type VI secretion system protein TssA n=1 Tax=Sphingomonas parva TaxID=2555898 RepID=UPI00142FA5DA|nr:type VI secretion system ImpA family N-terminal domain-containing protein [Sphingomonas parva]